MNRQNQRPAGRNARLHFNGDRTFHQEVRKRVDDYFRQTGARKRDCPQMYLKTAIIMTVFAASWGLLVFWANTWWQAVPLGIVLGLAVAGIGFNIEHDGGHNAYSNKRWVNRIMAFTLDLCGASSYVWRWKHAVFHHSYVNIKGHDADIELGGLGRLTPHDEHRWFFRWQHLYLWPLYGLMTIKWHFVDDFRDVITGRIGEQSFPRPKGWDLVAFIGGKALCFSLAFVIPLMFHPFWVVLAFYALVFGIVGVLLSIVFQLAHCVESATFAVPDEETGNIDNAWAIHQVNGTVNFARNSRIATWSLGGLNYQIEHHLFPAICHTNYPAISDIVKNTCLEFGIPYNEFPTFRAGVASHYRWLRQLGRPAPA